MIIQYDFSLNNKNYDQETNGYNDNLQEIFKGEILFQKFEALMTKKIESLHV